MKVFGEAAFFIVLFLIVVSIVVAGLVLAASVEIASVPSPSFSIHTDRDWRSPVIGVLPEKYSIYAIYDDGQSCWAAFQIGDEIGWVNMDLLPERQSRCWLTGKAIPEPTPVCIPDGKYTTCFQ